MLNVEHLEVWGFEHAIRGMRNPMNSWGKSDSQFIETVDFDPDNFYDSGFFKLGLEDLKLMRKLYLGGTEHRKFMRQIFISMDITAPLYWWKEFDTYKVGTTANSCSTMHKIHEKEFTLEDFSHEHLTKDWIKISTLIPYDIQETNSIELLNVTIDVLNRNRQKFLETKDKQYWWQMIQLLPSSYNQRRTVTMTYENAAVITHQRHNHKQDEWPCLVSIFIKDLPYFADIVGKKKS